MDGASGPSAPGSVSGTADLGCVPDGASAPDDRDRAPDRCSTARRTASARRTAAGPLAALVAAVAVGACAGNAALYDPTPGMLEAPAPDSFDVLVETSEGSFEIRMHRAWSPLGVDRVYHLMSNDFYAGARIYRMVPGFVAQWGFSGDPVLDSVWRERVLDDEPVVGTNTRGVVSFARAGPRSRSFTLFVNLEDNARLDEAEVGGVVGYPPIGEVRGDVAIVDGFYSAYDMEGSVQDSIRTLGNDYVRRAWPQLDSIVGTRVLRSWSGGP